LLSASPALVQESETRDDKKPAPEETAENKTAEEPEKNAAGEAEKNVAGQAEKKEEKRDIRFQFAGLPYKEVIQRFAQVSGKPIVGELAIEGNLTFSDTRAYTYSEALDTLNVILSMKGVVLVETERYLRLAPKDKLAQLPLKIFRGLETTGDVRPGEVVTVVLPLRYVDPKETASAASKLLSDAGSISPMVLGSGLVVTDRMSAIRRIEKLVVQLDIETTKNRELRTVRLVNAAGSVLAEILEKTFGEATAPKKAQFVATAGWKLAPPNPEEYVSVSFDQPTGTLILFGPPPLLSLAEELIERFEKDSRAAGELRIFFPRTMPATQLADLIRQGVPGVAGASDPPSPTGTVSSKARVIVDSNTNRLIVTALLPDQISKIEEFIEKVDRDKDDPRGSGRTRSDEIRISRVIRVEHAEPATTAEVVRASLSDRLRVHTDTNTRTIILVGSPGEVRGAETIVRELDRAPVSRRLAPRFLRGYPLRSRRASEIQSLVNDLVLEARAATSAAGETTAPAPTVLVDPNSNRLLITATEADHAHTVKILEELDQATKKEKRITKRLAIDAKVRSPSEWTSQIERVLGTPDSGTPDSGAPEIVFIPDDKGEGLLVLATEADHERIDRAIELIRSGTSPKPEPRETRSIPLTSKDPQAIVALVEKLYAAEASGREEASDPPSLVVDEENGRLLATGTTEQIARVHAILALVEPKERAIVRRETRSFPIAKRPASEVIDLAKMIDDAQTTDEDEATEPTWVASADEKSILVTGTTVQLERIAKTIALVAPAAAESPARTTKSISVTSTRIDSLIERVSATDRAQIAGREDETSEPPTLAEGGDGSSLLVTGTSEQIERIEKLVALLDTKPVVSSRTTRSFEVQSRKASEIATLVEKLHAAQIAGSPRDSTIEPDIVASADDRRLLVTGTTEQLERIGGILTQIDSKPEPETKSSSTVFRLDTASATEVAALLENAFRDEKNPRAFRVQVVEAGNSIIVTGSEEALSAAREMITQLDVRRPAAPREIRILPLRTGKASEAAKIIDESLAELWRSRFGPRVTPRARVIPDDASNRLVVTAPRDELVEIEKMVAEYNVIDQKEEDTRLVRLEHIDAAQLATSLRETLTTTDSRGQPIQRVRVAADTRNNAIVLRGPTEDLEPIIEYVARLDKQSDRSEAGTRFVNVAKGSASRISTLATSVWSKKSEGNREAERLSFAADDSSDRVIIIGPADLLDEAAKLLTSLSEEPPPAARTELETRFLPLAGAAELERVRPLLEDLYAQKRKSDDGRGPLAQFLSDIRTNRLIVTANAEDQALIGTLIEQLRTDRAPPPRRSVKVIDLADVEEIDSLVSQVRELYTAQSSDFPADIPEATLLEDTTRKRFVISGTPEQIALIETIVREVRASPPAKEPFQTRSIPTFGRKATELLSVVQSVYTAQVDGESLATARRAKIAVDASGRRFLVTGPKDELARFERIVRQLDPEAAAPPRREIRILRIQNDKGEAIRDLVETAFNADDEEKRLRAELNTVTKRLLLIGEKSVVDAAAELVAELDTKEAALPRELRVFELSTSRATQIRDTVEELLAEILKTKHGEDYSSTARIIADNDVQRLIVTASKEDLEEIAKLVEKLDTPAKDEKKTSRIFRLESGRAVELADALRGVFSMKDPNGRDVSMIRIAPDSSTNSLVVTGSEAEIERVEKIINELSSGSTKDSRTLREIKVQHRDAAELGTLVQEIFITSNPNDPSPATIRGDSLSKQIVVDANDEEFARIQKIVTTLDVRDPNKPPTPLERKLAVVDLESASASTVATLATEVYSQLLRSEHGEDYVPRATISPDPSDGRVVVTAPESELERIEGLVRSLDRPSSSENRVVRIVEVPSQTAARIAPLATEVWSAQNPDADDSTRVSLSADTNGDRVVIVAPSESIERVVELVSGLGKKPSLAGRELSIIDLRMRKATETAPLATSVYSSQFPDDSNPPPSITADDRAGRLIVVGSREQVERVSKIVADLDKRAEEAPKETRVYSLTNATANQLAVTVRELYREATIGDPLADPSAVLVLHDDATNRLIIRAPSAAFVMIESIVERLDEVTKHAGDTRVFELEIADAERLSTILSTTLVKRVGRVVSPRVNVAADKRSNTLIVSGDAKDLQSAEQIVQQLDTPRTTDARLLRTFTLPPLMAPDANNVALNVMKVYEEQLRGIENGGKPDALVLGDSVSARLIVTASEAHMPVLESVVLKITGAEAAAGRQMRVLTLKTSSANAVAEFIRQVHFREVASQRPEERIVVTPSSDDRTLILDAPDASFSRLEKLVADLEGRDRPAALEIRAYEIQGDTSRLAETLTKVFSARHQGDRRKLKPRFEANRDTGHVIVAAETEDLAEIQKMIEELQSSARFTEQTKTFLIANGEVDQVSQVLRDMLGLQFKDGLHTNGSTRVSTAHALGAILIRGPPDQIKLAETLVESLEKLEGKEPHVVRTVKLQKADASTLARSLVDNLRGNQHRDHFQPDVVITAEPNSNSLILKGAAQRVEEVLKLINDLDQDSRGTGIELRIFKLQHGRAREVSTLMRELLERLIRDQQQRNPGQRAPPLTITAHHRTNSLLVSTTEAYYSLIEKLLADFDAAPKPPDRHWEFFPLRNKNAHNLAAQLRSLYHHRAWQDQPVIDTDDYTNAISVVARREDLEHLRNKIRELDASPEKKELHVRVVPLATIPAEQMALLVQNIYTQVANAEVEVTTRLPKREQRYLRRLRRRDPPDAVKKTDSSDDEEEAEESAPSTQPSILPGGLRRLPGGGYQIIPGTTQGDAGTGGTTETPSGAPPGFLVALPQDAAQDSGDSGTDENANESPEPADPPPAVEGQTADDELIIIAVDKSSNTLLISGSREEIDQIEDLIWELSQTLVAGDAEFRAFAVKHADPVAVAKLLDDLFNPKTPTGTTTAGATILPPPNISAVADSRSRTVIVRAKPADFVLIEPMIQQLDAAEADHKVRFRRYRIENADPSSAFPLLQALIADFQRTRPGDVISVHLDPRTRSLIIGARIALFEEIEQIIAEVDGPSDFIDGNVLIVPLRKANAAQLATVLQAMVSPTSAGNATPEALALQRQVRRLRLRDANGQLVFLDLTKPIKIMADTTGASGGSNRLIVTSTPENLLALSAIVRRMDTVPVVPGVTVKLVQLEHTDAALVSTILGDIFAKGRLLSVGPGAPGEPETESGKALVQPINLSADLRTNTIVLSGQEATVALALGLIEDLDREHSAGDTEVRLFRLEHASATQILPALQAVFTEGSLSVPGASGLSAQVSRLRVARDDGAPRTNTRARPRAALTLQADTTTNTVIVATRVDTLPLIADVIRSLDIPAAGSLGSVRFYPLEHADAATVQSQISQLYVGAGTARVRAEDRAIINTDARTNALIVAGNDKAYAFVESLIFQLDRPAESGVATNIFTLQHNDAGVVRPALEQFFASRQARLSPGATTGFERVDITVDVLTNSLLVSCSVKNADVIKSLLEKLDVPSRGDGLQLRVFALQHADAQRAAVMVRSLIAQGIYRPGALTAVSRAPREGLAITVDSRTNSLVVSASPENLSVLDQLIRSIDGEGFNALAGVRVYQLEHALASRLAPVLQSFFDDRRDGEALIGDPERLVPVSVTPDSRTNTLLVAGSRESFAIVDRMITTLDSARDRTRDFVRIFPLQNATASKLETTLTELFLNRPSLASEPEPQPITTVADRWTNSLLVAATLEDLEMVASLVTQLDGEENARSVIRVIPLARASAESVAVSIDAMYSAEDPTAESGVVVTADSRVNALIVSAGDSDFARIQKLAQELDTGVVARVSEIRVIPLAHADATELAATLTNALNTRPASLTNESPELQRRLQFVTRSEDGEELVTSALQEGVLITPDTRTNSLVVSAPIENIPLLEQIVHNLDESSPQLAKIRVFTLTNADARQMSELLRQLFRVQTTSAAGDDGSGGDRSIRYELDDRPRPATSSGETSDEPSSAVAAAAPDDSEVTDSSVATVGTADRATLSITVDSRTNSILVGGTEHYVTLAEEIIEELDSSPAREQKTEVYRLKNAQATSVSTALTSFLTQRQQRFAQIDEATTGGSIEQTLEQEVAIVGDDESNTLLLSATPRAFDEIFKLIEELDQPQPQVLIEVLLAEVTLDDSLDLGVEWTFTPTVEGRDIFSATDFGVPGDLATFGGFSAAVSGGDFDFFLRALHSDGRLEVLSRPQILSSDNQEASINVGQRVPQVSGSVTTELGNVNNVIEYRQVGVILNVTPRISPDGFVRMELAPEISSLSSSSVDFGNGVTAPIFNERRATTTVSVQNGHTILIGGLVSTTNDEREEKIPILGDIPILGHLFKSRKITRQRTELLIILTPHVISTTQAANRATADAINESSVLESTVRDETQEELIDDLREKGKAAEKRSNEPVESPDTTNSSNPTP